MTTSYRKLPDGSWGVGVSSREAKPGDVITVVTKAGQTKRETLGELVQQTPWQDLFRTVRAAPAAQAAVGELTGVLALFAKAKTHLKRPAITLSVPEVDNTQDVEGWGIRLSIAGERAKVPGSITVTTSAFETTNDYGEPARAWLGRVTVEGVYQPSRDANGRTDAIVRRLTEFAREPAKVAGEHGRLTGRCCFCNLPLKDERSTGVGYGAICADHYGLPWGAKPTFFGEGA